MKVSVVLPVYNKAPWLRECLHSILGQTFGDFELIAVDDASTDDSLAILRAVGDPRLRVVALERNLGPAGAAQRAMDLAQGEYIARLDADDLMLPGRLAVQVSYMDAHPHIGASGGTVRLFGAEEGEWTYSPDDADCRAELVFGVPVPQGASIMRTEVLRRHGIRYQDHWPRIGEDWFFWLSLARHASFGNVADPLILYRRGTQNIAHGQDRAATRRHRIALVLRDLGLEPTPEEVEAHLLASHIVPVHVTRAQVAACHRWLDRLRAWNKASGFAPPEAMERRLRKAWDGLFNRLAARGMAPALEFLRCDGGWSLERLAYLAKARLAAVRRG
ncbi:MAG: glycosyltransferase family 2 protein [Flavobacteriales bacterium]|nr:glycosyltransferase family 2 protein [Flavobacteriales bacterium]